MGRQSYLLMVRVFPFLLLALWAAPSLGQGGVDGFNKLLALELPLIVQQLQGVIPASFGNCPASTASGPAPAPCEGTSDLFYVYKSWEYQAEARWVTGLKSINFTSLVLTSTPTNIWGGLMAHGLFGELPASIHISQCATFDKCTKIWDNTHACCGANKNFAANISVSCDTATHQLTSAGIQGLTIDPFEITESVGPIKLDPVDITNAVHDALMTQLTKYLTDPFISYNGTEITLIQYLNTKGAYYISQLC